MEEHRGSVFTVTGTSINARECYMALSLYSPVSLENPKQIGSNRWSTHWRHVRGKRRIGSRSMQKAIGPMLGISRTSLYMKTLVDKFNFVKTGLFYQLCARDRVTLVVV